MFVTGGTGYLGRQLITELLGRGHEVRVLARSGSESKLPGGCIAITGNALAASSFRDRISPVETFVQLVGVPRPSPAKAKQFRGIDLVSARASVAAAAESGVQHFIYVSVAHPAPVMKAYIEVRAEGESLIRAAGLNATILRPWYVLGPGHWWPAVLLPCYWVLEKIPATRESARRLGLVTRGQMIAALIKAVENPARGVRIIEVPEIRMSSG